MNKLVKKLNKSELIPEYLRVMNGILKLTDREIDVLALLMDFDINYPTDALLKDVANTENRKVMMQKLNITKDNLSRYIRSFKEKGLLKVGPSEDGLYVNKAIMPDIINDRIQLTFVLKTINDTKEN